MLHVDTVQTCCVLCAACSRSLGHCVEQCWKLHQKFSRVSNISITTTHGVMAQDVGMV